MWGTMSLTNALHVDGQPLLHESNWFFLLWTAYDSSWSRNMIWPSPYVLVSIVSWGTPLCMSLDTFTTFNPPNTITMSIYIVMQFYSVCHHWTGRRTCTFFYTFFHGIINTIPVPSLENLTSVYGDTRCFWNPTNDIATIFKSDIECHWQFSCRSFWILDTNALGFIRPVLFNVSSFWFCGTELVVNSVRVRSAAGSGRFMKHHI